MNEPRVDLEALVSRRAYRPSPSKVPARWSRKPIPSVSGRDFLERAIPYCLGEGLIEDLEISEFTTRLDFELDPGEASDVARHLERAYGRALGFEDVAPDQTPIPHLRPIDTTRTGGNIVDHLSWVAPGAFVGDSSLALLVERIGAMLRQLPQRQQPVALLAPGVVSWSTLDKAGYVAAFPQHVTSLGVVRPDIDVLDRFAKSTDNNERLHDLSVQPYALPPAACLFVFERIAGGPIDESEAFSIQAQCGRFEAGSVNDPWRLWTYRLHEFVVVGKRERVVEQRDAWIEQLAVVGEALGIPHAVNRSTDSFLGVEAAELGSYQGRFGTKVELQALGGDSPAALGSVNLHGDRLGRAFSITQDGQPAWTACIGFGLERMALAILESHGPHATSWPDALK